MSGRERQTSEDRVAAADREGKAALRVEILAAQEALRLAFQSGDTETIRRLVSPDHFDVTEFEESRKPVWKRIAESSLENFRSDIVSYNAVEELAPGLVLQRFEARIEGQYRGQALPSRIAVTMIWRREEGEWRQLFYQHTPMVDQVEALEAA